jgi:hypothetical protein
MSEERKEIDEKFFEELDRYIERWYREPERPRTRIDIFHRTKEREREGRTLSNWIGGSELTGFITDDMGRLTEPSEEAFWKGVDDAVNKKEKGFSRYLIQLIEEKNLKETDVYKNAFIDRRLFSKIRSDDDYTPKKSTAIAIAISMQLNIAETNELLGKAGYILSHSKKADVIVEFFINKRVYDFYRINEALKSRGEKTIGEDKYN